MFSLRPALYVQTLRSTVQRGKLCHIFTFYLLYQLSVAGIKNYYKLSGLKQHNRTTQNFAGHKSEVDPTG